MTLWGKSAETFEAESAPVIAFRGVKVGDFGGRSLSMVSSSTMMVEPDISSAHELRGWYDSAGHQEGFQTHSSAGGGANAGSFKTNEAKTITEVKDEGLGMSDTPQYFDVRATTVFIKQESFSYPACPADRCNKKLVMEGNDEWRCEKCDRTYPAPEYRCAFRYITLSEAYVSLNYAQIRALAFCRRSLWSMLAFRFQRCRPTHPRRLGGRARSHAIRRRSFFPQSLPTSCGQDLQLWLSCKERHVQ